MRRVLIEALRAPDTVLEDGHRLYRNRHGSIVEVRYPEGSEADLEGIIRWSIFPELRENVYTDERVLASIFG